MSSRVFIPVLCVGAVAFACGPRAHNDASTSKAAGTAVALTSKSETVLPQGAPSQGTARASKDRKAPVSAQISVRRNDGAIQLALRVVNTSKKRVEITFPSGQTYDFAVLDSLGNEMWRWGTDRMFTQAVRNKLLAAGESLDYEESLKSKPLPPGRYVARATLTSANYPIIEEAEFTITATTIASR